MNRRLALAALSALLFAGPLLTSLPRAAADPATCTETAEPGGSGLKVMMLKVPTGGTLCVDSGTYMLGTAPLRVPWAMTIQGVGATTPVIDCTEKTFCFDGSAGPDDVTLRNLVLRNATKSDVQIGLGSDDTSSVSGWVLDGITATGAGQVGITINSATDITVTNVTVVANGTTPYDATLKTSDFGLRANRVDGIVVQDSRFSDNPVVAEGAGVSDGFAGGAKFNTVTNALVEHNTFEGNSGGAQLWFDISSRDFHAVNNTVLATANAVNGDPTIEGIRAEVSCAGVGGSTIDSNQVQGGTTAAIDLFDSSGILVTHNTVAAAASADPDYGIRLNGTAHGAQMDSSCSPDGTTFPNTDNIVSGNTIDMTAKGAGATNGTTDDGTGVTDTDAFVANDYVMRHCTNHQWSWWDGTSQQIPDFATWQSLGQDLEGTCTSTIPDIDDVDPFTPTWGPAGTVVSIHGSGLQAVSAVTFNGKPGIVQAVSPTQVDAVVPAGVNATGPVCVSDVTDQRCTSTVFTVAPIVTVAGEAPASGRPGDTVAVSGQAFTGVAGVTFGGVPGAFSFVGDTEVDAVVPGGAAPGPVCITMPIQGTACGPTFSILPPDPPTETSLRSFELAPFSFAWSPVAGADSYQVTWASARFNGTFGPWQGPIGTTDTNAPAPFRLGTTICARVSAVNGGGTTPAATSRCAAVPLNDAAFARGKGWTRVLSSRYFEGSALTSRTSGATLRLTGVRAKRLALLLETRPGGGTVDVLLNGKVARRISTAAPTRTDQRLVLVGAWTALRTMSVEVRVASTNRLVVIDGLAVSRV